jgi:hypothetical protein
MSYIMYHQLERFVNRIVEIYDSDSPRGGGLVAALFVEELGDRLLEYYEPRQPTLPSRKRGKDSDWITKIDLLYRKQLITADQADRLDIMREIRNDFAHELDANTFEYGPIARSLGNPSDPKATFRLLFNECAFMLVGLIQHMYGEQKRSAWEYAEVRRNAFSILDEVNRGFRRARLENEGEGTRVYSTATGVQFRLGFDGKSLAGVRAFRLGNDWIEVPVDGGIFEEERLAAWAASTASDIWGTTGSDYPAYPD